MEKLYRVDVTLTDEFVLKFTELEVLKETEKTYKITRGVINKSKLLEIGTIFRNVVSSNKPSLRYRTFCLESQKKQAENCLKDFVLDRARNLIQGGKYLEKGILKIK